MIKSIQNQIIDNFLLVSGGDLVIYIGNKTGKNELTEWRLHIESPWRITHDSKALCGSLDFPIDDEDLEPFLKPLRKLIGKEILEIHITENIVDLRIDFEDHLTLHTFCNTNDGIHWELRHSDGKRLVGENMASIREWYEEPD